MRDCIVTGTGRSGTSMMAGVLDRSGYNTGDDYLGHQDPNPSGFFEDEAVNRLNDELLRTVVKAPPGWPIAAKLRLARRLSAMFPARLPSGALWLADLSEGREPRPTPQAAEKIKGLVSVRPFAYKDPRFAWTLPVWRPHLPADTVMVCTFREPGRTVNSVLTEMKTKRYRNTSMPRDRVLRMWQHSYERIIADDDRYGDWVFVHFDQMLDGTALPRLSEALEVELDASHVDPTLKRSADTADVPDAVKRVYERLCERAVS